MCRILVIFHKIPDTQQCIQSFIHQASSKKNTPGLDFQFDNDFHQDGCGWVFIKNNHIVTTEKYLFPHSPQYNGPYDILIGHLRHKGNECHGDPRLCNAHPFVHHDHVFCHNGFIRDFQSNKYLLPPLSFTPTGDTDSEHIFSVLLNLLPVHNHSMKDAVTTFFKICISRKIPILANFVWFWNGSLLITRYSNLFDNCCSLYFQNNIISSEPITNDFIIVPPNFIDYHYNLKQNFPS